MVFLILAVYAVGFACSLDALNCPLCDFILFAEFRNFAGQPCTAVCQFRRCILTAHLLNDFRPLRGKAFHLLGQVMSVLGNSKAPLHSIYNIWLVAFGVAILISTLQLYPTVAQVSSSISIMLFSVIVIYAVGGCILSGIFSVGETKSLETLSAKIHGYGSVIGFLLLTLAPLFVGLYFFKVSNGLLGILSLICFIFAIVFFALFVMADKPNYRGTIIAFEGLW